jgi:hypothetical protein
MNIPIYTSHAPWKAEFGGKTGGWGILSAREEIVAYVRQDMIHDEANANLIASAPDLLSALERLAHPMADDDDLDFARAIIAKAKGL